MSLRAFGETPGTVVLTVTPDSPAARAGVKPDDVIFQVTTRVRDGFGSSSPLSFAWSSWIDFEQRLLRVCCSWDGVQVNEDDLTGKGHDKVLAAITASGNGMLLAVRRPVLRREAVKHVTYAASQGEGRTGRLYGNLWLRLPCCRPSPL